MTGPRGWVPVFQSSLGDSGPRAHSVLQAGSSDCTTPDSPLHSPSILESRFPAHIGSGSGGGRVQGQGWGPERRCVLRGAAASAQKVLP